MAKTAKQLAAELDRVYLTLGRSRSREAMFRRSSAAHYNRLRTLENAVRRHANRECDCTTDRECVNALVRLVPKKPRPTLKQAVRHMDARASVRNLGGGA